MTRKKDIGITRRDLLRRSLAAGAAFALPSFLFSGAGCGISVISGGSNPEHYISFEVAFSKQMDVNSVEDALGVSPDEASFSGITTEWSANDTVLYCKLPCDAAGKTYTVTIGAAAKDAAGVAIDGNGDGNPGDAYSFTLVSV